MKPSSRRGMRSGNPARRSHGKRSLLARIANVRKAVVRVHGRTVERDVTMELAHAVLALKHAKQFVLNAERRAARVL